MLYGTQCVIWGNLSSNFYGEQIEYITKICLLDWVCGLIRKYKFPFSFKTATPSSINKMPLKTVCGTEVKPPPYSLEILLQNSIEK